MGEHIIRCEELTKRYPIPARGGMPPAGAVPRPAPAGGLLAVDRLDLGIPQGEFFGLLGPNGAGKTTTIGMLTTRVLPTSGRAEVAGIDVVRHPAAARERLAAVTQSNTLDRSLTVFQNLYFHGRYFRLPRAECRRRAQELLERFELTEKAGEQVIRLSGGLAKRVLIARALLHRPEVLFLDEPTSGLDPQTRLRLWEDLTALNRRGQTIVLTTHYIEEADRLCHRVAIIDRGRLLCLDTPQALKETIEAERLLKLTLAAEDDGELARAVSAVAGVLSAESHGKVLRVRARAVAGLVSGVVAAVAAAGAELRDLAVSEASLEEVFLKLTGKEYRE